MLTREMVVEFYYRELRGTLDEFPFEECFDAMVEEIRPKLIEHGQIGSWRDLRGRLEDIYGDLAEELPDWVKMESDFVWFSKEDAVDAIVKAHFELLNKTFGSVYEEVKQVYEELLFPPPTVRERALLFDRAIHVEHVTGVVFDEIDPDECRKEAEEMYEEHLGERRRRAWNE